MKSQLILLAALIGANLPAQAQEAGAAAPAIAFTGKSKVTESDPDLRQDAINWMAAQVEKKTGCKLKSIEASSPAQQEQWMGAKPAKASRREFEIWKISYCQRASTMMVRFDFTDKGVRFNADQMGDSENVPPSPASAANK